MKRLLAAALAAILMLLCAFPALAADSVSYRAQLTAQEAEIYDAIVKNISAHTPSFSVTITAPQSYRDAATAQKAVQEASLRAYEAFYRDHPEIFWVRKSGVTVRAETAPDGAQFKFTGAGVTVTFVQPEKLSEKQAALDAAVKKILAGATGSDYQKVLAFHNAIIAACSYDMAAKSAPSSYPDAYEAYGALVTGKAVCEGYSKAFKLLCDRAGIPCVIIGGTGQNEAHMWNYVRLDGAFYLIDCTFDDPVVGDPTTDFLLKGKDSTASHRPGGGFLQNFNAKFTDPTLSAKDYVPGKGGSSSAAAEKQKTSCKVSYAQMTGGTLVVSFVGGTGRVDPGQTVPGGIALEAVAKPAAGYTLKELKVTMGADTLSADGARSSFLFSATDDCRVTAVFQRAS